MEISAKFTQRNEKRLIKIEIRGSEVDLNDFESFKMKIDQESLHPHYKTRLLKAPDYFTKEDKCKLSIQIEKFLVIQRSNLEVPNKVAILKTKISSGQKNESLELARRKEKTNKRSRNALCSSACIIG